MSQRDRLKVISPIIRKAFCGLDQSVMCSSQQDEKGLAACATSYFVRMMNAGEFPECPTDIFSVALEGDTQDLVEIVLALKEGGIDGIDEVRGNDDGSSHLSVLLLLLCVGGKRKELRLVDALQKQLCKDVG